jgi:hypothetical protein
MIGYRLSVGGLLAVVGVIALWAASLRASTAATVSVATTATLAALLAAVLGAVIRRGPARTFFLGFAVFGVTYFVFVNWDWVGGPVGHDLTDGLRALAERAIPPDPNLATANSVYSSRNTPIPQLPPGFNYFEAAQNHEQRLGRFVQTGRMALTLLFALLGGLVGRAIARSEEAEEPTSRGA